MSRHLPPQTPQIAEQLYGLSLAAAVDYLLIPTLAHQTGHLAIALIASLLLGALIMLVVNDASRRIANATRRQQHGKARLAPREAAMRTLTWLVVLTMLAALISELFPAGAFK